MEHEGCKCVTECGWIWLCYIWSCFSLIVSTGVFLLVHLLNMKKDSDIIAPGQFDFIMHVCVCATVFVECLYVLREKCNMESARLSVLDNFATVRLCNENGHANDRQRKRQWDRTGGEGNSVTGAGQISEKRKYREWRSWTTDKDSGLFAGFGCWTEIKWKLGLMVCMLEYATSEDMQ